MIRYACYLVSRIDANDKTLIATSGDLFDALKAFDDYKSDYVDQKHKKIIERQRCQWVSDDKITIE